LSEINEPRDTFWQARCDLRHT